MSDQQGPITAADGSTVETLAQAIKNPKDFVKFWVGAIELAGKVEHNWRESAKVASNQFRGDAGTLGDASTVPKYNILYANIQTTCPAIYNSEPAPDVRQRFGVAMPDLTPMPQPVHPNAPPEQQMQAQQAMAQFEQMKQQAVTIAEGKNRDAKNVSDTIERAISVMGDMYDYDDAMQAAVKDRELLGRAVTRLRLNQIEDQGGNVVAKHITWEPVIWDDFRIGPAKRWPDVPWEAFGWLYTREELEALSPKYGAKVKLDMTLEGAPDKGSEVPDSFKRARVWEIWDRHKRQVYFVAPSFTEAPLEVTPDPYKLRDFFPNPKPLYAIKTTDSLVPICPFTVWAAQQAEMNSLTRRIGALIRVIRWRGVYDGAFEGAVQAMKNLDDGEMAPSPDAARALVQGEIEKAFWLMPIEQAIQTVKALYEAREICKQTIYELTGVADILRGATKANETLGAQQLKAEWGSLRLQSAQRDTQVHARDLMRLTADLLAGHFDETALEAMTGIRLSPQQMKLLKTDMAREFSIDIETDGTIKADLSRSQENVGGFIMGFGQFIEAVGPAVQAGFMDAVEAVGLLRTFARNFKLGREAEDILDDMQRRLEEKAKEPPQPPPPDPKVQAETIKAQAAMADSQANVQQTQINAQVSVADGQAKLAAIQAKAQADAQSHQQNLEAMQLDAAVKIGEHQLSRDAHHRETEASIREHELRLQTMDAQAEAKRAALAMKPKEKA